MSTLSTYTFLPYLRQGLANSITEGDTPDRTGTRGTINVKVAIQPEKVNESVGNPADSDVNIEKNIQIYGPGDIVGLDPRAIIKNEPRNWITNFEPNYLPYIEFYDEDFPWRYTPAASDTTKHRLRPWLTLIVLKEDEFEDVGGQTDKPLPYLKLKSEAQGLFPKANQLWAWAHVHVNGSMFEEMSDGHSKTTSGNMGAVLEKFQQTLSENRDKAYSRIICPRQLEANVAYHAFLVPTFESGRLAGLGLPPEQTPFVMLTGWEPYSGGAKADPEYYPYYYRWQFRTGTVGDFEYLVRLLQPKPADARIGNRDMDAHKPGSNLTGPVSPLKLGGALMAPFASVQNESGTAFTKAKWYEYEDWDEPFSNDFQKGLAQFINLSAEYEDKIIQEEADIKNRLNAVQEADLEDDPDPVITPPLYGRWHALQNRLSETPTGSAEVGRPPQPNWLNELNLDPRYRVPAGFGTKVIQDNQEKYMDAAWGQVGKIIEANRIIRQAQAAKEISLIWYSRHLLPLLQAYPEKALLLTTPVQRRLTFDTSVLLRDALQPTSPQFFVPPLQARTTAYYARTLSNVHPSLTSAPMRRVTRPRGKTMRTLPFDNAKDIRPNNWINRIATGEVKPAPPKEVPSKAITPDQLAAAAQPKGAPAWVLRWLNKNPWLRFLPLILALLIILLMLIFGVSAVLWGVGGVVATGLVYVFQLLNKWYRQSQAIQNSVAIEFPKRADVDRLPQSPNFRITEPGSSFRPTGGNSDSAEAVRFKQGLGDLFEMIDASVKASAEPVKRSLNVVELSKQMVNAINPEVIIPRRILGTLTLPPRLAALPVESFKEAMAYPEFDIPMYEPLREGADDKFVPNLNLLEQNSITLLQTNQKFIEAYMVGLNHEFARELLWREYPTDQRGSYFRQFWDVKSFFKPGVTDVEVLKEELRDIPKLHLWPKASVLGDHDHREKDGAVEEEVVLAIRGELLKKYPTAVVYAHKAEWDLQRNGQPDFSEPRKMTQLTAAEELQPPESKVKTPLYEAKVEPDIYFFGFDLTVKEARGNGQADSPGWFFVIKERPGEPRFGFDIPKEGESAPLHIWNDLSWAGLEISDSHIDLAGGKNAAVQLVNDPDWPDNPDAGEPPSEVHLAFLQSREDRHIRWNTADQSNAAELAYIMYQVPVLIAVHAEEMLPK